MQLRIQPSLLIALDESQVPITAGLVQIPAGVRYSAHSDALRALDVLTCSCSNIEWQQCRSTVQQSNASV